MENSKSFKTWLKSLEETYAIYDGSPPTTFNWEGSVGLPGGKVIDGDVLPKKKKRKNKK